MHWMFCPVQLSENKQMQPLKRFPNDKIEIKIVIAYLSKERSFRVSRFGNLGTLYQLEIQKHSMEGKDRSQYDC